MLYKALTLTLVLGTLAQAKEIKSNIWCDNRKTSAPTVTTSVLRLKSLKGQKIDSKIEGEFEGSASGFQKHGFDLVFDGTIEPIESLGENALKIELLTRDYKIRPGSGSDVPTTYYIIWEARRGEGVGYAKFGDTLMRLVCTTGP